MVFYMYIHNICIDKADFSPEHKSCQLQQEAHFFALLQGNASKDLSKHTISRITLVRQPTHSYAR